MSDDSKIRKRKKADQTEAFIIIDDEQNEQNRRSKRNQTPHRPLFDLKIFALLALIRLVSAFYNLIWDCDETYNYWEPLHFFLHGSGLQTWEYSPEYALRSYAYTLLHALPVWPLKFLLPHRKMLHFYFVRILFALASSLFETQLYTAIRDRVSPKVASFYFYFTLTNVGMFLSSTSFLPSSFAMHLITFSYAHWLTGNFNRAIFAIGCAVLLGWPFVVVFGFPIIVDYLFIRKKGLFNLARVVIVQGFVISMPILLIDSFFYGKLVFAPLNIFIYNVLSPKGGPDLYGREPFIYYIKNCILNFNVLYPIGLVAGVLIIYDWFKTNNHHYFRHMILIWTTMMLWLFVFMTRPHKEERFLYPIYPLLLVCAAACISIFVRHFKLLGFAQSLAKFVVLAHVLISFSRLLALLNNYSASIDIFVSLNQPELKHKSVNFENTELFNVCIGKEWYRFPSSFFLPESIHSPVKRQEWQLRFIKADFEGQLPGYFNEKLGLPASTRYIDPLFNDENKLVRERFIDPRKCHFLIDTNAETTDFLTIDSIRWRAIDRSRFLDSSSIITSNNLFKSFYIPFLYENNVKFTFFKLLLRD